DRPTDDRPTDDRPTDDRPTDDRPQPEAETGDQWLLRRQQGGDSADAPKQRLEASPKPADAGDDWIWCRRAQAWGPPAKNVPYGGALGEEIRSQVSEASWQEWQAMEVMVINELRLNFMDPASLDVLVVHMREFLGLDAPSAADDSADG
ncbi:MAG: Fe(2+)-trafficking protein, partial [Acidobacteriota bacterium]